MTFDDILGQAIEMLRRRGRLTYRALKRQFALDDEYLDDLKEALIYAHPQVVDDGQGLIWPAETSSTPETLYQSERRAAQHDTARHGNLFHTGSQVGGRTNGGIIHV